MATEQAKLVLPLESRRSLELPLSKVLSNGEIAIAPHVEAKGLLFLQFRKGKVILTAGRYVGLIPLTPNITVDVRPKLPVGNLCRVLDRARVSLEAIDGVDRLYLASGAASSSVLEFLLSNLVSSVQPIEEHGTYKEYVRTKSVGGSPNGRIKMTGTLQLCLARGVRHKVEVERFSQTSDVAPNRLIRAGLIFLVSALIRVRSDRSLLQRANEALGAFPEQVGEMTGRDYERCRRIVTARSLPEVRSYYYRALEIALLALSGQTVSLEKPGDDLRLETCIVDFEKVFEQYLRRVLQASSNGQVAVHDGNGEGKKPLFDDRKEPPAQPDIVLVHRESSRRLIIEVKYKDKPDRADINQAVTYALSYRTDRVVLVHQCKPGVIGGLRRLGVISGIAVDAYAYDLGRDDIEAEEVAFSGCLFGLLSAVVAAPKAA